MQGVTVQTMRYRVKEDADVYVSPHVQSAILYLQCPRPEIYRMSMSRLWPRLSLCSSLEGVQPRILQT